MRTPINCNMVKTVIAFFILTFHLCYYSYAGSCVGVVTTAGKTTTTVCCTGECSTCIQEKAEKTDDYCGTECQKTDCYFSGIGNTTTRQWYSGCDGASCDEDWIYLGSYLSFYLQFSTTPNNTCDCPPLD
jgi:hypothetical protein